MAWLPFHLDFELSGLSGVEQRPPRPGAGDTPGKMHPEQPEARRRNVGRSLTWQLREKSILRWAGFPIRPAGFRPDWKSGLPWETAESRRLI